MEDKLKKQHLIYSWTSTRISNELVQINEIHYNDHLIPENTIRKG